MSALPAPTAPAQGRLGRIASFLGSRTVIGIPFAWLLLFFAVPFFIVLKISVSDSDGINFMPLMSYEEGIAQLRIKLSNYEFIGSDELYFAAYLSSIKYAGITTAICLAIGYPFAYFMARSPASRRPALLMLVMLPFWTSFLLRIYAWKGLLDDNGVFNNILTGLGLLHDPIHMMHTPFSLVVGMVYAYLPFMILPLYANLAKMDLRLLEAAADLGTTPFRAFWLITVPLSRAGIIAGSMLVFIPCIGEFVIPELLGGPETLMIGRVLWDEFFSNNDWAMASAVAVVMILLIIVPLALFNHYQAEAEGRGQ
ncbi:ABC transporter permease subunit [Derxia gummosa]|uniref:ABC transporter permease subunit n=1 Tax=Derxia gummosa DSM 723 TaxID=1121388 RepID=A0A8B6X4E1_9BURK|nr:ABC transporter permease subunit [Derxia gummosa]